MLPTLLAAPEAAMLRSISSWMGNLPIADPVQRAQGLVLQALLFALVLTRLGFAIFAVFAPGPAPGGQREAINLAVIVVLLGILTLLRLGQLRIAGLALITLIITLVTQTIAEGEIQNSGIIAAGYMIAIALAGLLLSRLFLAIATLVCSAALAAVAATTVAPGVPTSVEVLYFTLIAAAFALLIDRYRITWEQTFEASRANEERLRLALDAGEMGTWDWDLRSDVIIWGGHHERIAGLPEGSFDGRLETFARLVHPDDLQNVLAAIERSRLQLTPFAEEYRVIWPDDSVRWTVGRGRFLPDRSAKAARMLGVINDITTRKLNEMQVIAAVAERDALLTRLQLVLERAPIGVIINDQNFLITYWNPAAERIFGWSAAEMLGTLPDDKLMTPAIRAQLTAIRTQIRASTTSLQAESENLCKDGAVIICEWTNTPLRDERGTFMGMLAMVQDITERRRREDEIRELNADLEQRVAERTAELAAKNRELEVFAYSVSHDLKAPLRGIDGYSRLLQEDFEGRLDGDGPYYISMIRSATARMGELIDDLLDYSRVERRVINRAGVDLRRVVKQAVVELGDLLSEAGMTVSIDLPALVVVVEEEGLAQALRNLIENAIKFSRATPRPNLIIGAAVEEQSCVLWLRDNGIGFAMEYHDRIFNLFQRLHRVEDYPGTGIGLAIVRKAIERSGGTVWAESVPGQGATFFLRLPLAPEEDP
jgi:PAS domain S-box-containing protein